MAEGNSQNLSRDQSIRPGIPYPGTLKSQSKTAVAMEVNTSLMLVMTTEYQKYNRQYNFF